MKCFFLMFPGIKRMEDKQNLGPLSDLIPFQSSDIKIPSESNALFHLVFERFPGHVWTQLFKSWGLGVTSAFFNFMYWNKVIPINTTLGILTTKKRICQFSICEDSIVLSFVKIIKYLLV